MSAISKTVNWNLSGKVTPAKYQGKCGDCWAFAATSLLESYILIRRNLNYADNKIDLSEEYVLECSGSNNDCEGGLVEDGLRTIVAPLGVGGGIPSESLYPYKALWTNVSKPMTPGICTTPLGFRNTYSNVTTFFKYFNLTAGNVRALLGYFPVATMIAADLNFVQYRTGVYQCPSESVSTSDLNHALVIVGYTADSWIIKNSWSDQWGIKGFGYVNMSRDCGLRLYVYTFNESTKSKSSYQSNLVAAISILVLALVAA